MPAGTFLPPGLTTSDVKISTGGTNNYVLTAVDSETIQGEANLTFDSSTLTVTGDAVVTDDLTLNTDSAVFNMGAGNDFTITHDGTTGATIAGNPITITSAGAATWSTSSGALTITSAAAATWSTSAGVLTIDGDDGIVLQTTGSGGVEIKEDVTITGTTPTLTIGDGGAEDTMIRFDGNEGDWYVALDDGTNSFMIGEGSTVGTDYRFRISDSNDFNYAYYMYHSFTSNGVGTSSVGLAVGVTLTGHADDSAFLAHMAVGEDIGGANITVNGNVTNVTTLHLSEPEINVSSGTVTNASTLYIANGPTEATNDYAIFVDSANLNRFDGGMQIGGDITLDSDGPWIYMKGGATSTNATGVAWTFNTADTRYSEIQMDYDTRASVGFLIHSGYPITIDATTQINFDISGATHMRVSGANPVVTIGDGGAEDTVLLFDGNAINFHAALDDTADAFVIGEGNTAGTTKRFTINATGKHYWGMSTYGAYTSSGSSSVAVGFAFETAVTAVAGDTSYQAHVIAGSNTSGSITTQNNSETISLISTLFINEPDITKGNDTVTTAATVYIVAAPDEATNNYSLFVDAGIARLDAGVIIGATTSTNALIDDSSTGSGSSTLYIGNSSITVSSDARLKTDIEPTSIDALGLIDELNVVDFGWNDPTDSSEYGKNYRGKYVGMLAQETVKIAPWIINDQGGGKDCLNCMSGLECETHGMFQVEYQHLVPTLVKAVQQLRQELKELQRG